MVTTGHNIATRPWQWAELASWLDSWDVTRHRGEVSQTSAIEWTKQIPVDGDKLGACPLGVLSDYRR